MNGPIAELERRIAIRRGAEGAGMSLNNLDAMKLRMSLDDTQTADEWISEVASLQAGLADERAKVAERDAMLKQLECQLDDVSEYREHIRRAGATVASWPKWKQGNVGVTTPAKLQSADTPADIRREVARECAEIAMRECSDSPCGSGVLWCIAIADAIRAKFGLSDS